MSTHQLSSQHHSFDIALAAVYGLKAAILIHHFQHWIGVNMRKPNGAKSNFRDGRWWTYQTLGDIAAHFPYMTKSEIYETIELLCTGKGRRSKKDPAFAPVLIKGNFNKHKFDQTVWYSFANQKDFAVLAQAKMRISSSQIADQPEPTPIPDTKPDTKPKEELFGSAEPTDLNSPDRIDFSGPDGSDFRMKGDVYIAMSKCCPKASAEEIEAAIAVLAEYDGVVHDWQAFLKGTIERCWKKKFAGKNNPKQEVAAVAPPENEPPRSKRNKKLSILACHNSEVVEILESMNLGENEIDTLSDNVSRIRSEENEGVNGKKIAWTRPAIIVLQKALENLGGKWCDKAKLLSKINPTVFELDLVEKYFKSLGVDNLEVPGLSLRETYDAAVCAVMAARENFQLRKIDSEEPELTLHEAYQQAVRKVQESR